MIHKKIIIIIIFLIMIITNINAEITINIVPKPEITGYSVEGGNLLPNTTYYFAAFYSQDMSIYYAEKTSGVGNMISVTTTDTNKSIRIDWTNRPPSAKTYIRWDTESLQDINGNWKKYTNYRYTTNSYSGHTGTGITLTTLANQGLTGYQSQLEFYVPQTDLDLKLNRTKGICEIIITGTENWNNLINALKNSAAHDMVFITENSLDLLCSIYGTGSLTFENKQINFLYSRNVNPNITFKNSQVSFIGPSQWIEQRGIYENVSFISESSVIILSSIDIPKSKDLFLLKLTSSTTYGSYYVPTTFKSISQFNFRYPRNNFYIQNLILEDTIILHTPIYNNNENIFYNDIEWKNQGKKSQDISLTDISYVTNRPEDFFQKIYLNNPKTDRVDKLPIILYPNLDSSSNLIDINFYVNFDLNFTIESDSNFVENANITLTDNNGNNYSLLTNENGFSTIRLNTHLITYDSLNLNGLRSKIIDLNPITITIKKDGYEEYNTKLEILEKTNISINLPKNHFIVGAIFKENKEIKSFSGIINDIKIYTLLKSSEHIKTEYLNQVMPNNFYRLGKLEVNRT